jgi:hypothetical protein
VRVSKSRGCPVQSLNVLPPVHCSVCGPSAPSYARSAVQLPTRAVRLPWKIPPVSSGLTAPSSSPSTVPVVPLRATHTPVTPHSFSVTAADRSRELAAAPRSRRGGTAGSAAERRESCPPHSRRVEQALRETLRRRLVTLSRQSSAATSCRRDARFVTDAARPPFPAHAIGRGPSACRHGSAAITRPGKAIAHGRFHTPSSGTPARAELRTSNPVR